MTGAALTKVLVSHFTRLPEWGKFTVVGAALVLITVLVMGFPMQKAEAALHAAETLKIRVEQQRVQLNRIEEKLDRLTIHLIPPK